MSPKRLAIVAVAVILVAAVAVLALMPAPDDRTETEKLVLTASDLAGMNATQLSGPFPSPYHPNLHYGGSEAAESGFSLTVDGWFMDVSCVLVLYNSSSLAGQAFLDLELDDNYSEVSVGDGCFVGGYHNETEGPYVIRSNIHAVMLDNDTIAHFVFRTYPVDGSGAILLEGSGTISIRNLEGVLKAQANKVQLGT